MEAAARIRRTVKKGFFCILKPPKIMSTQIKVICLKLGEKVSVYFSFQVTVSITQINRII